MAKEIKQSKRGGARPNAGRKRKPADDTAQVQAQAPVSPAAHLERYQFQPGQSGNPAGRPKGSRSKLGEAFLADFYEDWAQHGKAAIATVRKERPQDYLKAAVSILPKEVKVTPGDYDEMSDDQLDRLIRGLAAAIQLEIGTGEGAGGEETAH